MKYRNTSGSFFGEEGKVGRRGWVGRKSGEGERRKSGTDEGERGERGGKKEMMHGVYEGMFVVVGRGWDGWRLRGGTEWFTVGRPGGGGDVKEGGRAG